MTYDPHDYTTWDWRAEYREPDRERGFNGEWQVNAYVPGNDDEEAGWVCSLGGGHVPEDEKAAKLIARAPVLAAESERLRERLRALVSELEGAAEAADDEADRLVRNATPEHPLRSDLAGFKRGEAVAKDYAARRIDYLLRDPGPE